MQYILFYFSFKTLGLKHVPEGKMYYTFKPRLSMHLEIKEHVP